MSDMPEDAKPTYEKECTNQQLWKMVHERDKVIEQMREALKLAAKYLCKGADGDGTIGEALTAAEEILNTQTNGQD